MRRAHGRTGAILFASALVAACTSVSQPITQSPFVRTASDGASLLTAASETLRRVHGEQPTLTVEYGQGSFINYHELVLPIPEELPTLEGAPDQATVDALVAGLDESLAALAAPCLVGECGWEAQVDTFDETAEALRAATQ